MLAGIEDGLIAIRNPCLSSLTSQIRLACGMQRGST